MSHTPTPWITGGTHFHGMGVKSTSLYGKAEKGMQSGRLIARGVNLPDAAFIETAVNAHEDLVKALQDAIFAMKVFHGEAGWEIYERSAPEYQRMQQALSKAGVKP